MGGGGGLAIRGGVVRNNWCLIKVSYVVHPYNVCFECALERGRGAVLPKIPINFRASSDKEP